jgi:hypothetical protein
LSKKNKKDFNELFIDTKTAYHNLAFAIISQSIKDFKRSPFKEYQIIKSDYFENLCLLADINYFQIKSYCRKFIRDYIQTHQTITLKKLQLKQQFLLKLILKIIFLFLYYQLLLSKALFQFHSESFNKTILFKITISTSRFFFSYPGIPP